MSCPVYYFFQLILRVTLDSTLDSVDKGLRLTQALAKEGFEFILSNKNIFLIFQLLLILLVAKQGNILGKDGGKWYPILTLSPSRGKMFLILLKEVITPQVSFILIYVWHAGLHQPFTKVFLLLRSWYRSQRKSKSSRIQNGPEDPLEVIFKVLDYRR